MRGQAGKQGPRPFAAKAVSNRFRGEECLSSETRHEPWVSGNQRNRSEHVGSELLPMVNEGLQQLAPGFSVVSEGRLCLGEVAFENDCRTVVEWMGHARRRVYPFQAVVGKRQRRKEWRAGAKRIHS